MPFQVPFNEIIDYIKVQYYELIQWLMIVHASPYKPHMYLENPSLVPVIVSTIFFALLIMVVKLKSEKPNRKRTVLKWLVFSLRSLMIILLALAIAGPFIETEKEVRHQPYVKLIIDNSSSMDVVNGQHIEDLADQLEMSLSVKKYYIGSGLDSRIFTNMLKHIGPEEHIILFSDGYSNGGISLESLGAYSSSLNTSISIIRPEADKKDYQVHISGPEIVMEQTEATFTVSITALSSMTLPKIKVTLDGNIIFNTQPNSSMISFTERFTKGSHVIEASIDEDDFFTQNNKAFMTIEAVEKPTIAIATTQPTSPLTEVLSTLYHTTIIDPSKRFPKNLSDNYALIIDDVPADLLNSETNLISEFLRDGNGMVVFGGDHSFEHGAYKGSNFETLLPVITASADKKDPKVNIVIVIDISASTGMFGHFRPIDVEKALAIDVVDQIGNKNKLGIAAFNTKGYVVLDVSKIEDKSIFKDKISRLRDGGGTYISAGILTGVKMLRNLAGSKNLILISDGQANTNDNYEEASKLAWNEGIKIYTIATGADINTEVMGKIASLSNGISMIANNSNRIKLIFGKEDDQRPQLFYDLAIVDDNHFITENLELSSNVGSYNDMVPRDISRLLVATSSADPMVVAWQFGLGRVVVFGSDNGFEYAGSVYGRDSRLISRMVSYAVSDPQRKKDNYVRIYDTTQGVPANIRVKSDSMPTSDTVTFRQNPDMSYFATLDSPKTGVFNILGKSFAVNYNLEYKNLGFNPELIQLATMTGGKVIEPDAKTIFQNALSRARTVERTKSYATSAIMMLVILLFILEVFIRRFIQNMIFASED